MNPQYDDFGYIINPDDEAFYDQLELSLLHLVGCTLESPLFVISLFIPDDQNLLETCLEK